MPRNCAYCDTAVGRTREHVFSDCLLQRAPELDGGTIAHRPGQFTPGHQVIRDVCAVCNNERLSELDDYICGLYDRYFGIYVSDGERIRFEYEYDLLLRWILKTAYNSDRANTLDGGGTDLKDYSSYALGEDAIPHNLHVFLLLVKVYELDALDRQLGEADEFVETGILPTVGMGVTRMVFAHPTVRRVTGYLVLIRSYFFFLLITPGNGTFDLNAIRRVQANMLDGRTGLTRIPRNGRQVEVPASELNTVDAYARFNLAL